VARRVGGAATPATVAVAHHQDDQAETVLMNFVRGSGLAGLAGMAWVGVLPVPGGEPVPSTTAVRLIRPLLGASRDNILAYLAAYGLTWYEDITNQDTVYLRNQVRRVILPMLSTLNPALVETLARTAGFFAAEAERAGRLDRAAFAALLVAPPDANRVLLDLAQLAGLDRATQRGVIRQALLRLGGDRRETGLAGIDRLLAALAGSVRARGPHPLAQGIVWTVLPAAAGQPARLSLHRAEALPIVPTHPHLGIGWTPQPVPPEGAIRCDGWELVSTLVAPADLPSGWCSRTRPWRAFLDAGQAHDLLLATPRPGLQIAPLGLGGRRRSVGDLFTDRKTPVALRAGWPLVLAGDEVVWVCGLAPAHSARVTKTTRQVRVLEWQPAADSHPEATDGSAS
jgi:tRNA(Ile)-lysidine synthase